MIDAAYILCMARYNRWQNESLYRVADGLTDDARRLMRGAFFRLLDPSHAQPYSVGRHDLDEPLCKNRQAASGHVRLG